jgi:hypothetical protein
MGWNIAIITTSGTKDLIETLIPDIFYKSKEDLFFEDATSSMIGNGLTVGYDNNQIIIIDVLGRFIGDERFAKEISAINGSSKSFWIAEEPIYRSYEKGELKSECEGKEQIANRLSQLNITSIDEWGETMIFQLFNFEVFGIGKGDYQTPLSKLKFDLYELD